MFEGYRVQFEEQKDKVDLLSLQRPCLALSAPRVLTSARVVQAERRYKRMLENSVMDSLRLAEENDQLRLLAANSQRWL